MSTAYTVIPGLLLLGFAAAVQVLFPQVTHSVAGWLMGFGAMIIQL